jgi:pimeloyl-ACP methyl ester carboxylesterase
MAAARLAEAVMSRRGSKRSVWLIVTVVATLLTWTSALPVAADTPGPYSSPSACPGAPPSLNLGNTTPVLLVHGFLEDPGVYTTGSPSLVEAIKAAIPNVTTIAFNYKAANTDWVTTPAIGPQLAQCITWLAQTSYKNGGPGKVIIVAHSMGGLAVRCAVDATCVKNGGKGPAANPNMIGLVVTLGTPNTGSILADAATSFASGYKGSKAHAKPTGAIENMDWLLCQAIPACPGVAAGYDTPAARAMQLGSSDLDPKALKPLPSSIPLDAIAGKISLTTTLLTAGLYALPTGADIGDVVVSVGSAQDTQGVAPHPGTGNWQPTIDCGSIPVDSFVSWPTPKVLLQLPDVKCWHLTETTDAVWQKDIITAMQPVAQSLSLLACTHTTILAALAAKDPTSAAQRTLVASACEGDWGVVEVHQPLTRP